MPLGAEAETSAQGLVLAVGMGLTVMIINVKKEDDMLPFFKARFRRVSDLDSVIEDYDRFGPEFHRCIKETKEGKCTKNDLYLGQNLICPGV